MSACAAGLSIAESAMPSGYPSQRAPPCRRKSVMVGFQLAAVQWF
jgi:hypothetical protein